jgi:hypothetical protein
MKTLTDITLEELRLVEGGYAGQRNTQLTPSYPVCPVPPCCDDQESAGITRAGLKRKWTPPHIDIMPFDGPRLGA